MVVQSAVRSNNSPLQHARGRKGLTTAFSKPVTRRIENRPRSTKLFSQASKYPMTRPSYVEDYEPKPLVHTPCVYSGTSSGNRRNNPHPSEAFMVWRLSSRLPSLIEEVRASTANLRPQELIVQQQLKSTYQDDYLGMQQGELPPLQSKADLSSRSACKPSYSLASSMRQAYQMPRQTPHLKGNITRYGCSVGIVKAACGVVPTLHPKSTDDSYQTWYGTEYGTRARKGSRIPTPIPAPLPTHTRLPPIDTSTLKPQLTHAGKRSRKEKKSEKKARFTQQPAAWLSEWSGPM